MRVYAISDLHGSLPEIPECDVLLIAGDLCLDRTSPWDYGMMRMRQMEWLDSDYREWEADCPAKHILVTPGNHDWIEEFPEGLRSRFLVDEEVVIEEKRFWFTPWVSPVMDWNYMLNREQRAERFALIPEGLDVLVSHSPAHKVLDRSYYNNENCGCPELRQAIYRAKPKFCVFGHIHEGRRDGYSGMKLGETEMRNVAMWGQGWKPTHIVL